MSKREEYQAGTEARRAVPHRAGSEAASTDHVEALLRYLKGAGHGQSTGTGRTKPFNDADIRTLAIALVDEAGGKTDAALVAAGSVWLRGRVGHRSQIAALERKLSEIPGVTRLDLKLNYDTDDL